MKQLRKIKYDIKEIQKEEALKMIKKYHYSNTLPRLNKHFVGFYLKNKLVGLVTLGWGTQPKGTIQNLFPMLESKDYYEIGRMCMTEEMPRNSESQMLSQLIKWIKLNLPDIKILFTWSDGMLGKCGYVYQSANFLYAGKIKTTIYLKDGVKIHPRQTKKLFGKGKEDKRLTARPTIKEMKDHNIKFFKGIQYKYLYFTCNKKIKKQLLKECLVNLNCNYPKDNDLIWWIKNLNNGKWDESQKPQYKTDENE